ncbi:transposase [Spirosoma sp. SC4-14]|uniref:transposase n=1 Tax=Spirosoma sp. SC4-14 TaxID=3128900 RepID=UPI0030D1B861
MYDEAFKGMARPGVPVELLYAKGSIQDAARELGIDPGRIRKWRQRHQKNDQIQPANATLSDEQQQIRRLQRELREAQMDRPAEAARHTKSFQPTSLVKSGCLILPISGPAKAGYT